MKLNEERCPYCGEYHEVRYSYNNVPLIACPMMPKDQVQFYPHKVTTKQDYLKAELIGKQLARAPDRSEGAFIAAAQADIDAKVESTKRQMQSAYNAIYGDSTVSRDTQGEDCGIYPLQIRGWPVKACRWHDAAYTEKSWHQGHMTRLEVDRAFLTQLLNLSGNHLGKRILSYFLYRVARIFGARFWEGTKE